MQTPREPRRTPRSRPRTSNLPVNDNPRGVELMTLCQMTSFDPVPDDYDKLLTEIAKAYPAPEKAPQGRTTGAIPSDISDTIASTCSAPG